MYMSYWAPVRGCDSGCSHPRPYPMTPLLYLQTPNPMGGT